MSDRPPRPDPLGVNPDAVPDTLTEREAWVCWRYKFDTDRDEWTKVPVDADTGGFAKSTDPDTWVSFATALAYHELGDTDTDGVGFVAHDNDTVLGLDLDDVRDPDTGDLERWAEDLLERVDTYAEVSPSGTGLRLFGLGFVPDGGNRADVDDGAGHLEMYDTGRYLTVTGQRVDGSPDDVAQVNDAVAAVHAEYIADKPKTAGDGGVQADSPGSTPTPGGDTGGSPDLTDDELLEKAKNAGNGEKFTRLWNGNTSGYPSHSEADLALCGLLAFWTGGDRRQMDELFQKSGLYREKWDEDRGSQTYGERTIDKALKGRTEFYEPPDDDTQTPPPKRTDTGLQQAIKTNTDDWINPDTKTWTVRDTEDHKAFLITDALREGELPGDNDLGELVLSGKLPDDVEEALKEWRNDPDAWTYTVDREFGDADLDPAAIATALNVAPGQLGEERNGELAYEIWNRVREGEHAHIIARMGERADSALFTCDPDTKVWKETGAEDIHTLGRDALEQAYTKRVGNELEEQVRTTREPDAPFGQVHIDEFGAPADTVPVANGILDLEQRELRERRPDDYVLAALPVAFDPDAECPTFTEYLEDVCPRSTDRQKLQEYVGYTLMHWKLKYHKSLFIAGPQASGKSTFLDTVKSLLGDETTCSLAPQEMTEERFAGYNLWGAWANIRSDIPSDLIDNTGKFKELVAGDPVKVEKKHQDPISIEPKAKHLFAANTLPQADISDDAFFRRILMVSFPKTIPRDERDNDLDEKIEAELPGILNWALDGLDRLRDQGHFTGDLPPAETQGKWRSWGKSIDRFKERCLDFDAAATETELKSETYEAYCDFCEQQGIPAESRQKFGREIKKHSAVGDRQVTVDGRQKWAYTGFELTGVPDADDTPGPQAGLF